MVIASTEWERVMTTTNTIELQLTAAKLSNQLRPEDLERVVGGLTVSKVSDASSPKLLATAGPEPSPPKSIDVFQFVQAFA
jgi:hypothetical protein